MHPTIQGVFEATDDGDEWGHNREFAFGIAYTLYFRGEDVPNAWEFNPGIATEETMECFVADMLLAEYDADTITGDDLREFGNMLDTESEELRAAGKSY